MRCKLLKSLYHMVFVVTMKRHEAHISCFGLEIVTEQAFLILMNSSMFPVNEM